MIQADIKITVPKDPFNGVSGFFSGKGLVIVSKKTKRLAYEFANRLRERILAENVLRRGVIANFRDPKSKEAESDDPDDPRVSELYAKNIVVELDPDGLTYQVVLRNVSVSGYVADLERMARSREEGIMGILKPLPIWKNAGREEASRIRGGAISVGIVKVLSKPLKQIYKKSMRECRVVRF